MRDLLELSDALDLTVSSAAGIAPPDAITAARTMLVRLRTRGATIGATLTVAIAGGTGTGKSSVLNAIAGEQVASTSRIRPHTDRPLAWIPAEPDAGLELLLDDLGVTDRRLQTTVPGLAIIDLPDVDSVVAEHTAAALDVIRTADAILWVLDPEKHNDAELDTAVLAPMAGYAPQTAFVLNKLDLMAAEEVPDVLRALRARLGRTGYPDALVFPLAAAPHSGPPQGIDPLVRFLGRRVDHKRVAIGKLLTEVARTVENLGRAAGVWNGSELQWLERWASTREAAIGALRPDVGLPNEDALCRIEDLVAVSAVEVGGVLGETLRGRFDEDEVVRVMTSALHAVAESDHDEARRILDTEVGVVIEDLLAQRARFAAQVALTHIGARQLAQRHGVGLP